MASTPTNSMDTTLNSSLAHPGMIHQVLVAAAVLQEREPLANHVVRNVPESGAVIARNTQEGSLAIDQWRCLPHARRLSLTSTTPSRVYKRARQPTAVEYSQRQQSTLSSPLLLQEELWPCRRFWPYCRQS